MDDWTPKLPTLRVDAHRYNYDEVTVELRASGDHGRKPTLTVTVPREALADPRLELGAVWTLTPDVRPLSYSERLERARAARELGHELTAEEEEMLAGELPPIDTVPWDD